MHDNLAMRRICECCYNGVLVNESDVFGCRYTFCAEYVIVGMCVDGQEVPMGEKERK